MKKKQNPLRITASFFLGFLAGLSFVSGVLPFLLSTALGVPSLDVLMEVDPFTKQVAIAWAAAGGLLGWLGGPKAGGLALGGVGLATGLFLGLVPLGGAPMLVVVSVVAGVLYGGCGGLLLGNLFARRREEE